MAREDPRPSCNIRLSRQDQQRLRMLSAALGIRRGDVVREMLPHADVLLVLRRLEDLMEQDAEWRATNPAGKLLGDFEKWLSGARDLIAEHAELLQFEIPSYWQRPRGRRGK